MKRRVLLLVGSILAAALLLWAASQGPNLPGTGTDGGDAGAAWTSPGNITASDNVYATRGLTAVYNISNWLIGTNFGFSIPAGATIDGFVVTIARKASVADAVNMSTGGVQLVYDGAGVGAAKTSSVFWPTVEADQDFGSSTDKWSTSLTAAQINDPTFGLRLKVFRPSTNATASVDAVWITVSYTSVAKRQILNISWLEPSRLRPRSPIQAVRLYWLCQDAKNSMMINSTALKCSAQRPFRFDGTNAYALSPGVTNM